MRLHVIQHVPFEGPGLIGEWASESGCEITADLSLTEEYPTASTIDLLCVMGGPMDADDEVASPWLRAEKRYIAECIAGGGAVLGICLGAQIIAEVLGGRVRRGRHKEIGWYPVALTEEGRSEQLFSAWPETFVTGQWHGDTFELPRGIAPLISSEAFPHQAFVFDRRVVGLQFHLEWTLDGLTALVEACRGELGQRGLWMMSADELLEAAPERIATNRPLLFSLLDALAEQAARGIAKGAR